MINKKVNQEVHFNVANIYVGIFYLK